MKITDVRDALVLTGIPTYHFYAADPKPERYIIWGETSAASVLSADDEIIILKPRGEIWFYTADEYDEGIAEICEALNVEYLPTECAPYFPAADSSIWTAAAEGSRCFPLKFPVRSVWNKYAAVQCAFRTQPE